MICAGSDNNEEEEWEEAEQEEEEEEEERSVQPIRGARSCNEEIFRDSQRSFRGGQLSTLTATFTILEANIVPFTPVLNRLI